MKKQIIEKLSTKFSGVSESILDRIAAKLAKTIKEESEIEAAVEAVTFQSVLESYGDSRATEASASAVKNYETKYGLKDGIKAAKEGEDTKSDNSNTDPEPPAWAKQMMEDNKALKAQLDSMNAEKTNTARRSQLDAVVSKLPEALRAPYARIDVSALSDEDFQTQLTSITTEVDGIASAMRTKGAVFGAPTSQFGRKTDKNDEVNPVVLAELEAQSKKGDEGAQNF